MQSQDPRGLAGVWPEQQLAPTEQGLTCPELGLQTPPGEGMEGDQRPSRSCPLLHLCSLTSSFPTPTLPPPITIFIFFLGRKF